MEDDEEELIHHIGSDHIAKFRAFDIDNAPKALKKLTYEERSFSEGVC